MPRAGIEPALSGPQPDVLPLYYRGDIYFNLFILHSTDLLSIELIKSKEKYIFCISGTPYHFHGKKAIHFKV